MEIVRLVVQDGVDLTINGRLDSYWAEHLDYSLAEAVREGHDRLRLDLSRVTFLSSAGIAVLMKYSKQLRAIDGELVVLSPSQQVRTVLDMTRLTVHLVEAVDRTAARAARRQESVAVEREGARLEVFDLVPGAVLRGGSVATKESGAALRCPDSLFAIGVGAIGASLTECRERFGEFLALAGAAVSCLGTARTCRTISSRPGRKRPKCRCCAASPEKVSSLVCCVSIPPRRGPWVWPSWRRGASSFPEAKRPVWRLSQKWRVWSARRCGIRPRS